MELARIQASSNTTISDGSNPAKLQDPTKSSSDLCTPQPVLYPQQWPHILAPGEPQLYNELATTEFTAGYLAIVEKCPHTTQKSLFLHHLADLMSLVCSYQWLIGPNFFFGKGCMLHNIIESSVITNLSMVFSSSCKRSFFFNVPLQIITPHFAKLNLCKSLPNHLNYPKVYIVMYLGFFCHGSNTV